MEKYDTGEFSGALVWLEKAAEQGNAEAQFWCGHMYHFDIGETEEDKEKALMWYEKAADAKSWIVLTWTETQLKARLRCFDMYYKGEGTAEDKAKALMWYKKAVERVKDVRKFYDDKRQRLQKELQKDKMAQSYYNKLQRYLYSYRTAETARMRKIIDEARRLGDLSENEVYHEAKEAERSLHRFIEGIEEILQQAVTVDGSAVD